MAKRLELPQRLQLLADWVPQGTRLADVGTDHAYLPVWLLVNGRVSSAIASDLRKGPLERARETGRLYGAVGIEYRLCNGLADIAPDEVDTIVIAGMGGETIAAILEAAPWTRSGNHVLLLQPMTKSAELRSYLASHGYWIMQEALVYDRGTIYPVMKVTPGESSLTLGQVYGGVALQRDPLADRYLIERIIRFQGALAGVKKSGNAADGEKAEHLRDVITALLEMREEWRRANCT